jgi:carotenoid cleavage dioxygenase-like enzyme
VIIIIIIIILLIFIFISMKLTAVLKSLVWNLWSAFTWYFLGRKAESPFLRGNFGPVNHELDLGQLPISGQIPFDLHGMFVRTGPNPKYPPIGEYHWFEGDGMLHGVQLAPEGAYYHNRFVRTEKLKGEIKKGKAFYFGLGVMASNLLVIIFEHLRRRFGFETRMRGGLDDTRGNTAVEYFGGRLLALFEVALPIQVLLPCYRKEVSSHLTISSDSCADIGHGRPV